MTNEINHTAREQALAVDEYLQQHRITFAAVLVGETDRDGWTCDEWRVHLTKHAEPNEYTPSRPGKTRVTFSTPYFTGTGHRAKPRKRMSWDTSPRPVAPTAASVLRCLISDAQGAEQPFDYWCADYGYDTDSMKALNTHNACCNIRRELAAIFTATERAELAAMLEDY